MTPFRTALDQLAALVVPGITTHFGIDTLPETVARAQLPALVTLPLETDTLRLTADPAGGVFEALAFANTPREITLRINHLLLVAPAAGGSGLRTHLPRLIDLLDAYFEALGANVTLNDTLAAPARVQVQPGLLPFGGVLYVGCALRHQWTLTR